jgi:hypothetical protein
MDRRDAIAWVLSVCLGSLRLSQAKTLSVLVGAALGLERVSLANLGRALAGPHAAKHAIKRAWRFIANGRVEPVLAMTGVVRRLLRKRRKPLLVSLDWTDVRGLQTLMAAAVIRGRAVPLCWASCTKHVYDGHKSRNAFEESLLLALRNMIEPTTPVILLADRGFGRTELGRFCQRYGFRYVIRIKGDVIIRVGSLRVRLDLYPVRKGVCRLLQDVLYRDRDPLTQHVVIRWKKGLPKKRDEPWYLMTDIDKPARWLSDLYGRRMSVEQFFRDKKSKRNGWSLRDTLIKRADRLDRLLLILALAYLLLVGLGLCASGRFGSGRWAANNRKRECSLFQVGRLMLDRLRIKIHLILRALLATSGSEVAKWG